MRAIPILQDVAVNGSNVGREHAPKHALNLAAPTGTRVNAVRERGKLLAATFRNRTERSGTHFPIIANS